MSFNWQLKDRVLVFLCFFPRVTEPKRQCNEHKHTTAQHPVNVQDKVMDTDPITMHKRVQFSQAISEKS